MSFKNKKQSAIKGQSSAVVVTVILHLVFFLVAGTFVALEVVERKEAKFEGKQIVRPKMKLKKLQVPVKIEKKVRRQAPTLGKGRGMAVQAVQTQSVDFKMPEMSGLSTGGLTLSPGSSLGGSLGFATTQINVFGLKSTGEKLVFLLDTNNGMLVDEVGGIPAYTIIKKELLDLIDALPPTALFNVIIFNRGAAKAFSEELSPATDAALQKIKAWLGPLNSSKDKIGFSTLPNQGFTIKFEPMTPILTRQNSWLCGMSYAVQKRADSVYWLGADAYLPEVHRDLYRDYKRGKTVEHPGGWPPGSGGTDWKSYSGGQKRWNQRVAIAREKLKKENARRKAAGQPIRVIPGFGGSHELVRMYDATAPLPANKRDPFIYRYTGADILDYIEALTEKYAGRDRRDASIGLKKKKMSFNVIRFVPERKTPAPIQRLKMVAEKMRGKYEQIAGLKAIQSAAEKK